MKPICAICGRRTEPFVMIGNAVIGPKCAQRAGLMPLAKRKSGLVFPVVAWIGRRIAAEVAP